MEPRSPDSQNGALEQASPFPLQGQVAPTPSSKGSRAPGRGTAAGRPQFRGRRRDETVTDQHGDSTRRALPQGLPLHLAAPGRRGALAQLGASPRRAGWRQQPAPQSEHCGLLSRKAGAASSRCFLPGPELGVQPDAGPAAADTARKPTSPRSFPGYGNRTGAWWPTTRRSYCSFRNVATSVFLKTLPRHCLLEVFPRVSQSWLQPSIHLFSPTRKLASSQEPQTPSALGSLFNNWP